MRKESAVPRPPTVLLLHAPTCPISMRAMELLAFTGAQVESRPIAPSDAALLAAGGVGVAPIQSALEGSGPSFAIVAGTRAAILDFPERVLELFALPLPPGETEGSFMRRILQNRLV